VSGLFNSCRNTSPKGPQSHAETGALLLPRVDQRVVGQLPVTRASSTNQAVHRKMNG